MKSNKFFLHHKTQNRICQLKLAFKEEAHEVLRFDIC